MHEILALWRDLMHQGTQFLAQEKYSDAVELFARCVPLAETLEIPEYLAFTLRLLATTRAHLGQWELAERGFRLALEICRELKNPKGLAEAWAGLARVSVARGDLLAAVQFYEQAMAVYPVSSPRVRLAMLHSDLGQVYVALEEWDQAKQSYQAAKELCHNNGFAKGEGDMEVLLGELYYLQGYEATARNCFRQACIIFAQSGDFHALATALQYLAFLYYDQKDWSRATECQQRAVVLWLKEQCLGEASESIYFLSKIEQGSGAFSEAEKHLEFSLKLYAKEDIGLALRLQSMALLALTQQDIAKAEEYFREALRWFELLGDEVRAGEVCSALGFLIEAQGRQQEGSDYHKLAVEKMEGYGTTALYALQRLGESMEKRNKYLDSLNYYWQALQLARIWDLQVAEIEAAIQRISQRIRRKNKNWRSYLQE